MGDGWTELSTWLRVTKLEGAGVALGIYIHRGMGERPRYNVVAIETPIAAAPTLRAVLDNRAQMVIASDLSTLGEAKNQGEEYIDRWRAARLGTQPQGQAP
jgi:hypothetical protein